MPALRYPLIIIGLMPAFCFTIFSNLPVFATRILFWGGEFTCALVTVRWYNGGRFYITSLSILSADVRLIAGKWLTGRDVLK